MKKLALLLSIFVLSCSSTPGPQIQTKQCSITMVGVIDTVPEKYIPIIVEEINYWRDATGVRVFFNAGVFPISFDQAYDAFIVPIDVFPDLYRDGKKICGLATKRYQNKSGCIVKGKVALNESCFNNDIGILRTVVRHELGHILGLVDSRVETDLMAWRVNRYMSHPIDATEEEIRKVREIYEIY